MNECALQVRLGIYALPRSDKCFQERQQLGSLECYFNWYTNVLNFSVWL